MTRWLAALAVLALWGCDRPKVVNDDATCTAVRARPVPDAGFMPIGHSHNDYEHDTPLFEAIDQRFYSVEADVWYRSAQVVVSHDSYSSKGTLKDLYLDPLQALVDANGGSVYGDGVQFVLWLELKDGSLGLRDGIKGLLEQYPMMTVFSDDAVQVGPVVAVLTGNDASKKVMVDENSVRRVVRDSNEYSASDKSVDNRWQYYALDWKSWVAWDGADTIPDAERRRLACVVGDIHQKGKKVRFWNSPVTPATFDQLIAVGADFINTDDLPALADYLNALQP